VSGAADPVDRRREPRRPASGPVQLRLEDEAGREMHAELVDVSHPGFRTSHRNGVLPLGAMVVFRHPEAAGRARVVWNWMHDGYVESGFVIVR